MGLLLSGGIDSAVLLGQLLCRGSSVVPFYVRTGSAWEKWELAAARRFMSALRHGALSDLIVLEVSLGDLYGDHWSLSGIDVPDDQTPDDAVYMPGRNPLLLIKPALWCQMHGITQLALATLANNPFDDATPQFFTAFEAMIREATQERVEIKRPFEQLQKRQVMELGRNVPLELTFSCLSPIDGMHCGQCNKCAERQLAFRQIQLVDRTQYAASPRASRPVRASSAK
jgi:7-cyano-7-deazaguanine synthase